MRDKLFWCALAAELALLALLPRFGDFSQSGNALKFVAIFLAAGLAYFLAVASLGTLAKMPRRRIFWIAAIALRAAVFVMPPGDDLWRYVWEGCVQLHGENPYRHAPESAALAPLRDEDWTRINHREWPAIYPPGAEWLFAEMARVSTRPWFFKAVFTLADLGVVFLLTRINTGFARHRAAAWYAWNPLVVCAFAGAGHFDSLMLLPLTAAVWALRRAMPLDAATGRAAWTWAALSAAFLGVAISIKTVPVFLLPVWTFALGSRSVALALSVAIPWLLALPYGGLAVVTKPLRDFAAVTRFNDLVWWIFNEPFWPAAVKQTVNNCWFHFLPWLGLNPYYENSRYTFLLAVAVCAISFFLRRDWPRAMLWVLGAVLILSPALHPWYVTWILPAACARKSLPWFVLSISVAVCLLVWEAGPFWNAWEMNLPLRLAVLAPPLLALYFLKRKNEPAHE